MQHVSADGRLALHQVSFESGLGNIKGGLHAGDAAAHDQGVGADREGGRRQRSLMGDAQDTGPGKNLGLLGGFVFILGDPRNLLPHGYHVKRSEWIETGPLTGRPKGFFVHARGTGSHDHPGEMVLPDIFFDQLLAGIGAHEQVVPGNDYIR